MMFLEFVTYSTSLVLFEKGVVLICFCSTSKEKEKIYRSQSKDDTKGSLGVFLLIVYHNEKMKLTENHFQHSTENH